MGIVSNIRNFFYAATHANKLIADNQRMRQELAENSSIIDTQANELHSMSEANEALIRSSDLGNAKIEEMEKRATIHQLHVPKGPIGMTPVGRIDYLSHSGKVIEAVEFNEAQDFMLEIKDANDCGRPMSITVYSYNGKPLIDTSWRLELDPPPQGFQVVPYDRAESLKRFSAKELENELNKRIFTQVSIESTADYSDPTFYPQIKENATVDQFRVVTFGLPGNHIAPMTGPLDSYEAAIDAISGNSTLQMVDYPEFVDEAAMRQQGVGTAVLSLYSTAQLQERLAQLNQEAAMESPTPTPEPTLEFEIE